MTLAEFCANIGKMSKNNNIYEISYSLRQERRRFIRRAVFFVAAFFIIMNSILTFAICPVEQKSRSMEPNIPGGAFVFATPLGGKIKRGEIVIVAPRAKRLSLKQKTADFISGVATFQKVHPWTNENSMTRRVAALPGDTIYMKDFILYVKPQDQKHFFTEFELNQIPYSVDITVPPTGWSPEIGVRGSFEKITLGENEYYVLGDNRLSCVDSRIFGKIKESSIQKRVLMIFFPFKRAKIFVSKK